MKFRKTKFLYRTANFTLYLPTGQLKLRQSFKVSFTSSVARAITATEYESKAYKRMRYIDGL
jgi:hypothetical protein